MIRKLLNSTKMVQPWIDLDPNDNAKPLVALQCISASEYLVLKDIKFSWTDILN